MLCWNEVAKKVDTISNIVLNEGHGALEDVASGDEAFMVWAVRSKFLTTDYLPAESFWTIVHVFSCI